MSTVEKYKYKYMEEEEEYGEEPDTSEVGLPYGNLPLFEKSKNTISYFRETTKLSEINDILGKKQHKFLDVIDLNILRYKQSFSLNIIKIKIDNLLPNYINTFGDILIFKDDIVVIKKDNIIYSAFYFRNINESIQLDIYASSIEEINIGYKLFKNHISDILCNDNSEKIQLTWYLISNGRSCLYTKTENLDDIFLPESYPYVDCERYIKNYLEGNEPVLLLMGPPGTGKTRFIRHILKRSLNIIKNKDKNIMNCLFTSSKEIIEEGKIYMDLIFTETNFLVLEDIDYHLKPRTGGNSSLYNLLSVSNGLMSNAMNNKKIILSTNLPNVKDIDDALLRQGRCFGILNTKKLNKLEAEVVAKLIGRDDLPDKKSYSLAEIYNKGYK